MASWNEVLEMAGWDGEMDPAPVCGLGLMERDWQPLTEQQANDLFKKRARRTRLELGEVEGGEDFTSSPTTYCTADLVEIPEGLLARIEFSQEEPVYALGVAP